MTYYDEQLQQLQQQMARSNQLEAMGSRNSPIPKIINIIATTSSE